jgi:hypothetical protein
VKVKITLIEKEHALQERKELYTYTEMTEAGKITFALVNFGVGFNDWHIVEYTTGLSVLRDIGKLTKTRFERLSRLVINMNPRKLKDRINENEKIN